MTRILLTAATLIGLTTAAFAQSYSSPPQYPWSQSYVNQRSATYGGTYGPEATPSPNTPVPASGD